MDEKWVRWLLGVVWAAGVGVAAHTLRVHIGVLLGAWGLSFGAYWLVCSRESDRATDWQWWLVFGVVLRVVAVFAEPHLSDDYFRFVWDGRLSALHGINPFAYTPTEILDRQLVGLDSTLYQMLNSKPYYSVYPLSCQVVFGASCALFPHSVLASAYVMKGVLLLGECASLVLMVRLLGELRLPVQRVLWYALNPLVIVEYCGNIHFEGWMIGAWLLGWYWLRQGRWLPSAGAISVAIATKLLPVVGMVFLVRRLRWRVWVVYFAAVGLLSLLLFAPFLAHLANMGDSLQLYFQRFEFNAGLYYWLRPLVSWWRGYNWIQVLGPFLAMISVVLLAVRWLTERKPTLDNWADAIVWALTMYWMCATTVHPWYLGTALAWSVFTRWRFVALWTGLATLSYTKYALGYEVLWLVSLEYVAVLAYIWYEYQKPYKSSF
jgi:alpha-1,6-mannosyltransferase